MQLNALMLRVCMHHTGRPFPDSPALSLSHTDSLPRVLCLSPEQGHRSGQAGVDPVPDPGTPRSSYLALLPNPAPSSLSLLAQLGQGLSSGRSLQGRELSVLLDSQASWKRRAQVRTP